MTLALILVPLLGCLAVFMLPSLWSRALALATGALNFGITLAAWFWLDPTGINYALDIPWVSEAGIHFAMSLDGISMLLVLLTNLLAPLIILSSFERRFDSERRYYGLLLMMLMALNGVFMADDGLLFYVFYELALLPIYFICAIWGGEDRIRITLKFFIYTFAGSLCMLLSLLYLYLHTDVEGAHSFLWKDLVAVELAPNAAAWVLMGFFLAFAVKMPLFPFHTWQPDTYVSAPTGGAMLLSGIMLKMGLYGSLRWMIPMAPEALHTWTPVFLALAVTGIVYASIIAVKQRDLKRLIAYSSIAHVGLIAAGILAWNKAGLQGGLLQMLNHGINVVGLFFVVDVIERRLGTRSMGDLGGIAKSAPGFATLFMIILLGAVAVPLTNGFPGEFLLLNSVWNYANWLGAAAGLTIILGAVYMLRAYGLTMFGETNAQTAAFPALQTREWVVLGLISALVLLLGFFPQVILQLTDSGVSRILGAVQL